MSSLIRKRCRKLLHCSYVFRMLDFRKRARKRHKLPVHVRHHTCKSGHHCSLRPDRRIAMATSKIQLVADRYRHLRRYSSCRHCVDWRHNATTIGDILCSAEAVGTQHATGDDRWCHLANWIESCAETGWLQIFVDCKSIENNKKKHRMNWEQINAFDKNVACTKTSVPKNMGTTLWRHSQLELFFLYAQWNVHYLRKLKLGGDEDYTSNLLSNYCQLSYCLKFKQQSIFVYWIMSDKRALSD